MPPSQADEILLWKGGEPLLLACRTLAAHACKAPEEKLSEQASFQSQVSDWLSECFGPAWRNDPDERLHRFVEEAIELAQAAGCTREEFHLLIDYVYGRPAGEVPKEVGGVMVTLAGLCEIMNIDLVQAAADELRNNYARIQIIRKKRQSRRGQSPLPG